jgi:peptide/nickel transport system substrate-binding protein
MHQPSRLLFVLAAALAICTMTAVAAADPRHGLAMHGEPALPTDFKQLPYANPDAPQGGELRQAIVGAFDSISPFIVKGNEAVGIRTYVVESLMGRNWDEPFSLYGLLAESIDVSDDRQTFTFRLRPEAKFSDGTPVTAEDVAFSMQVLRDKGRPNFKANYSQITKVETPDARTIVFYQDAGNRELPLIVGLMPVLPKHAWDGKTFDQSSLEPMIGSGPYTIGEIKPGEAIVYKKNPNYWGKSLPFNRGLWNFDTVRYDYYRDANAAFEAFKKGEVDVRTESDPVRWSSGYDFSAVKDKQVVIEKIAQKTPAAASGFVFNTRRKIFEDPRVREALIHAFDFEWANANLFANSYQRTYGYFSGSELSSKGLPMNPAEAAMLGGSADKQRADFKDGSYALPVSDGSGRDRKLLRKAVALFGDAGWKIGDQGMVNEAGEQFAFVISIINKEQEKIALHFQRTLQQIGIKADVRIVDSAQFNRMRSDFDFDMISWSWFNSLSPGNEQKSYFGEGSRDAKGSRNYPGVADPGVNSAIEAMLKAKSRDEFVTAVRALDRTLVSGFYIIPFYDAGGQWVARWSRIGRPERQPLTGFEATTLWREPGQ